MDLNRVLDSWETRDEGKLLSLSLERERGRGEARRAGAMTINLDDVCIRSRLIIG